MKTTLSLIDSVSPGNPITRFTKSVSGSSGRNGGLMLNGVTGGDDLDRAVAEHALTRLAIGDLFNLTDLSCV